MRFTIERIRTLVLVAGVLLVVAIAVFLAADRFKRTVARDIPKRLGLEIQQEANGVTYTQAHGGHTVFKIHASRVVQLRNSHASLHNVEIDLYGQDGRSVDTIKGDEFEYNQKTEIATAAGPVLITLQRPVQAMTAQPEQPPGKQTVANRAISVQTSGITFVQKTGVVSTSRRVNFSSGQGSGSSMGARYDADSGVLTLDRAVDMTVQPRTGSHARAVRIHAAHADFDRNQEVFHFTQATARMQNAQASAGIAEIDLRDDGTVARLTASGGFTLTTAAGSRIAAPAGQMQFTENDLPRSAHLRGGVQLASQQPGRTLTGSAATADLTFAGAGELHHLHLADNVEMHSQEQSESAGNGHSVPLELTRTWRSNIADVDFRPVAQGRVEPARLHGSGGVVLTGETRRGNQPDRPSRLAADDLTGIFGPHGTLRTLTGAGHASLRQTAADGAVQTATADRMQAQFAPASSSRRAGSSTASAQLASAQFDGDVVLDEQPAARTGGQQPFHATAGHAVYQSAGQWLHLTESPRANDGGMALSADALDVSQQSGQAFAHGHVKATWMQTGSGSGQPAFSLGGRGPAHVIANQAELQQSTGEAFFRGQARLWQDANSVSAPLLILNRNQPSLIARTRSAAQPVVAVLLTSPAGPRAQPAEPSIVRVRGGDLFYSGSGRKALFRAAPLRMVTAESGGVTSTAAQVELYLSPSGAHPGQAAAQVERMTARGDVVVRSQGRRGTGQELAYSGSSGDYVLTGSPAAPPRLSDPLRGSVTGKALIFHSRDDSVSIEGGQQETTTRTTAPR